MGHGPAFRNQFQQAPAGQGFQQSNMGNQFRQAPMGQALQRSPHNPMPTAMGQFSPAAQQMQFQPSQQVAPMQAQLQQSPSAMSAMDDANLLQRMAHYQRIG